MGDIHLLLTESFYSKVVGKQQGCEKDILKNVLQKNLNLTPINDEQINSKKVHGARCYRVLQLCMKDTSKIKSFTKPVSID